MDIRIGGDEVGFVEKRILNFHFRQYTEEMRIKSSCHPDKGFRLISEPKSERPVLQYRLPKRLAI
jgi:hypothetical protein